jgi:hypothetical protein
MARYDRQHDYGMRGPRELPNRVTQRYNREYTRDRPSPPTRNFNPYGGDHPDRIGDERTYRRPYITTGGTRTFRGAPPPVPRDGFVGNYDEDYSDYL